MRVVAIVQARTGSIRLPKKVMRDICGLPMIEILLARLNRSTEVHEVLIATSSNVRDQALVKFANKIGFTCYAGKEYDVLDRYLCCARQAKADVIVRITGDCPLIDPELVDDAVRKFVSEGVDYLSNGSPHTFPDGLDVEVFSFSALERSAAESVTKFDREHVTSYMRNPKLFRLSFVNNDEDLSTIRWTVDEWPDLIVVRNIFKNFYPDIFFSWKKALEYHRDQDLSEGNQHLKRNEGMDMGTGQKLWKRAKHLIPGGNMLLSKRAEMFLPDQWPSYFSKARGCEVWDLDGKKYIDMSIMGIGTNVLGYGHPEIDEVVKNTVSSGNMSTLNCPEEVYLSEKLVELNPWASMVRLARTGGEANAIAVRIARAASGRDKVAVCGYHGWHDWYLAANLEGEESLNGHLLPGLDPSGVPRNLKGSVIPFTYNRLDELEHIIHTNEVGVIKMEVVRNKGPENNFLQKVRELATLNEIVLVFDECTSGFRQNFGGIHMEYGVEPDMAIFGKALGNGYAITAVVGRDEIMDNAQSTFISSTFWTERIGPTAALKTLEIMERERSWETITDTGKVIRDRWSQLANKNGLPIEVNGIPAISSFNFPTENALAYKTLITQELLKKGYLASNLIFVSTSHTADVLNGYFEALDAAFALIRDCEDGLEVGTILDGPICHSGFRRLN